MEQEKLIVILRNLRQFVFINIAYTKMNYNNPNLPPQPSLPFYPTQPPYPHQPQSQPPHPLRPQPYPHNQYRSAYQYYHQQYQHQYQPYPYPPPHTSTNNYHNNYYIHNNGSIHNIGLDNYSSHSNNNLGRNDQIDNPLLIIQRALMTQSGSWQGFFTRNHGGQIPNEASIQTSNNNTNNQLSIAEILHNIDKSCSNSSEPKQHTSTSPNQQPHDNPIYSKINKSRNSEQRSQGSNNRDNKNEGDADQKKNNVYHNSASHINKSKFNRFNSLSSEAIFEKVESIYELKKIHTEQSADEPSVNTIKHEDSEELEADQKSKMPPISAPVANAHKNIRNKIITNISNIKPLLHILKTDFGIQVNIPEMIESTNFNKNQPVARKQSQDMEISNMSQISELSPIQRDKNVESICLPSRLREKPDIVIKLQESIYESTPRKRAKTQHNRLSPKDANHNSKFMNKTNFQIQPVFVKNKEKQQQLANVPHLQSIQSINTISESDDTPKQQNQQKQSSVDLSIDDQREVIEESKEIEQSFAESDVLEKRSTIKYKAIVDVNMKEQQNSAQKNESIQIENMKIPHLPMQSPTSMYQEQTSIKFTQSKQQPMLLYTRKNHSENTKYHLPTSITASKLTNIISSFSELKQLIEFQFKEFHLYIKDWVESIIQQYEAVLMEKEQCIFVLQLEKISLEDQLREAELKINQRPQKQGQDLKRYSNINVVIKQPQSRQFVKKSKSKRKSDKYKQKETWKELNDMEEILSAQIYKIEAERDKQFDEVMMLQKNTGK